MVKNSDDNQESKGEVPKLGTPGGTKQEFGQHPTEVIAKRPPKETR